MSVLGYCSAQRPNHGCVGEGQVGLDGHDRSQNLGLSREPAQVLEEAYEIVVVVGLVQVPGKMPPEVVGGWGQVPPCVRRRLGSAGDQCAGSGEELPVRRCEFGWVELPAEVVADHVVLTDRGPVPDPATDHQPESDQPFAGGLGIAGFQVAGRLPQQRQHVRGDVGVLGEDGEQLVELSLAGGEPVEADGERGGHCAVAGLFIRDVKGGRAVGSQPLRDPAGGLVRTRSIDDPVADRGVDEAEQDRPAAGQRCQSTKHSRGKTVQPKLQRQSRLLLGHGVHDDGAGAARE